MQTISQRPRELPCEARVVETIEAITKAIQDIDTKAQPKLDPAMATFSDNADENHPAKIIFHVDGDREVLDIKLSVYSEPFRAYASSVASGGGATRTSSITNTGHVHPFAVPFHRHSIGGDLGGNIHMVLVIDPTGELIPVLRVNAASTTGIVSEAEGGTAESGGGSHDHQVTIEPHVHPLAFGIYEYTNDGRVRYAGARAYVNDAGCMTPISVFGVQGSVDEPFECSGLSLKSFYNPAGSGGPNVIAPGVNRLYIKPIADATKNPNGLLRLYVNIQIAYKS